MSNANQCCFVGRGKISVKPYFCPTVAVPNDLFSFEEVGNASNFTITPNINELTVKNYTSAAGGTECSFDEIESIDFEMTLTCANTKNLAKGFLGKEVNVAGAAVTNETHLVESLDSVVVLKNPLASTPAIVVTNVGGTTTYVLGTDYTVSGNSIYFPAGSTIALGSSIEVDYTKKAQDVVELLTSTSLEVEVKFDGINAASGNAFLVHLYRVKLSPIQGFSFIGDDFAEFTIGGKLLIDTIKSASVSGSSTFSKYGIIQLA